MPDSITRADKTTVIGMAGPEVAQATLKDEGFFDELTVEFRGLVSRFATKPVQNEPVTLKLTGKQYRIKSVQTTPDGLTYILNLVAMTS